MYIELKEIYDNTRLDYFSMAITYVVDIGWRNAKAITDEEIDEAQGNGLMTTDFVKWIMRTARDIAIASSPTEIVQFCDAMGVYETSRYTNGECLNRSDLEKIAEGLIHHALNHELISFNYDTEEESIDALAEYLGVDSDDIESICGKGV